MTTFDAAMAEKLSALGKLSRMLRVAGTSRSVAPEQMLDAEYGFGRAVGAMIGLTAPDRSWYERAACGLLLDVYMPGWRQRARPEVLGPILDRTAPEVQAWRQQVLNRDGHACTKCGSTERLHAHHIARWVDVPEARIIVGNGVTLCEPCHIAEHHGNRDGGSDRGFDSA